MTEFVYLYGANFSHGDSQVTTPDLGRDFNEGFLGMESDALRQSKALGC
jgi:hypothetical protein